MKLLQRIFFVVSVAILSVVLYACGDDDKLNNINMRVEGDYVQWQFEGDKEWKNLIALDDLKGEKVKKAKMEKMALALKQLQLMTTMR